MLKVEINRWSHGFAERLQLGIFKSYRALVLPLQPARVGKRRDLDLRFEEAPLPAFFRPGICLPCNLTFGKRDVRPFFCAAFLLPSRVKLF